MQAAKKYYEWFKDQTIQKMDTFLSAIRTEDKEWDGTVKFGFVNTEAEALLTEPMEELKNQSVISIIYGADLVELLPCEEITNTLQE